MWGTIIGIPITLIAWGMKRYSKHFQMSLTTSWAIAKPDSISMDLQEQTTTYKETSRLANVGFIGGATSFLEVFWAHYSAQSTRSTFVCLARYLVFRPSAVQANGAKHRL